MGYALAEPGSASWAFKKSGTVWEPTTTVPVSALDEKKLEELLIALDEHDDVEDVFTNAS
jgi:transcriptional/translational regulatory protein YebC/TACO1